MWKIIMVKKEREEGLVKMAEEKISGRKKM